MKFNEDKDFFGIEGVKSHYQKADERYLLTNWAAIENNANVHEENITPIIQKQLKEEGVKFEAAMKTRDFDDYPTFVIFASKKGEYFFWSFDCVNKYLMNKQGPYESLNVAISNASTQGLFESVKNTRSFAAIYESSRY